LLLSACSKIDEPESLETIDSEAFDANQSFEAQIMSIPNNSLESVALVSAYSEIMAEVLTMSKDADFRNYIFQDAQEANARDEDYVIDLNRMTKTLKTSSKFGKSSIKVEAMVAKFQDLSPDETPMVFFPKAETLEENRTANKGYDVAKNLNEPIAVLKGAYNDDYSAPGYKLNAEGELVFDRMVTEEDAWENSVYVIGMAEKFSTTPIAFPSDPYGGGGGGGSGGGGTPPSDNRTDGRAEYGGKIQVTDLNEIEHWFSGKLEFQIIVAGVQGSADTVISNRKFKKTKRKNFRDRKWHDFNHFIANWNKSNLGQWNVEKWIERWWNSSRSQYQYARSASY